MPNKMLIDASHPEETRVVVTRGNRIEEFDFESQDKKQLRGNIYLARVTRVEPSLQAAFVEYGGNRHGFLAFSEIHPDYYQIPVADRQALLLAEAEAAENDDDEESEDEERNGDRNGRGRRRRRGRNRGRPDEARTKSGEDAENGEIGAVESSAETAAEQTEEILAVATEEIDSEVSIADSDDETPKTMAAAVDLEVVSEAAPSADEDRGTVEEIEPHHAEESEIESVGAGDALDEVRTRRKPLVVTTRFRKSSSGGRSCWCRW
jgi:ribonuclease E